MLGCVWGADGGVDGGASFLRRWNVSSRSCSSPSLGSSLLMSRCSSSFVNRERGILSCKLLAAILKAFQLPSLRFLLISTQVKCSELNSTGMGDLSSVPLAVA